MDDVVQLVTKFFGTLCPFMEAKHLRATAYHIEEMNRQSGLIPL